MIGKDSPTVREILTAGPNWLSRKRFLTHRECFRTPRRLFVTGGNYSRSGGNYFAVTLTVTGMTGMSGAVRDFTTCAIETLRSLSLDTIAKRVCRYAGGPQADALNVPLWTVRSDPVQWMSRPVSQHL